MESTRHIAQRRTNADVVFDALYDEIISLRLLPGTKMSEVEVAAQFDVSRQPVRDAFSRLGNMGFLLIRPQKATEVKKFSNLAITRARFVRTSVEVEIVTRAAAHYSEKDAPIFAQNLAAQQAAVQSNDVDAFHQLDYDFHRQLCETAQCAFAFDTVMENKAQIDRLCVLSMMDNDAMAVLVQDHQDIHKWIRTHDAKAAQAALRLHLSRLDGTVERVRLSHPDYFI